jgi:hypothetical protein
MDKLDADVLIIGYGPVGQASAAGAPPPLPSFLAPDDLAALMTGAHFA